MLNFNPGAVDWSGGVFASCITQSNCTLTRAIGWPQFALQHHWLLPINCHFRDCKARCTLTRKLRYIRNRPLFLTNCSVSWDTVQYRLKEGVSHRRTRQATQLFTYLLMQRPTAATSTSVCLLLRRDSTRRPRWPSTIAENLGRYLSGAQRTAQGKDFELILTVKM